MKQLFSFRNTALMILSLTVVFASCSKKDADLSAPVAAFAGNFTVTDDTETYIMKVETKGGNKFAIRNFGGFLNAPLNAVADGSSLTIPSQTFTNPNGNKLTIVGTGTLQTKATRDDTIVWNYSVSGFTSYSGEIVATRQ